MGDYRGMNDCRESDPPEVVETGSAAWRWVRTRGCRRFLDARARIRHYTRSKDSGW